MAAHVHSKLMFEYAKDSAETDKPWERWEGMIAGEFVPLTGSPGWDPDRMYRRKPVPLCKIEGRDVFEGDTLWHKTRGVKFIPDYYTCGELRMSGDGLPWFVKVENLTWTEPKKILCQLEGRNVLNGDMLWYTPLKGSTAKAGWVVAGSTYYGGCIYSKDGVAHAISGLSWNKPPSTKKIYQWAFKYQDGWFMTAGFFETEEEAKRSSGDSSMDFRRLDYTMLEVPA